MVVLIRAFQVLFLPVLLAVASEPCAEGDETCAANLGNGDKPEELPEELPAGEMPEDGEDLELVSEEYSDGDDDEDLSDEEGDKEGDKEGKKEDNEFGDLYAPDPFTSYNENETDEEREAEFERMGGYLDESLYAPANYSDEYKRRTVFYTLRQWAERIKGLQPLTLEEKMKLLEQDAEEETTEEFFARLDSNHDGTLTVEEWPLANPGPLVTSKDPQGPFHKADENKDGKISMAEFPALITASIDTDE